MIWQQSGSFTEMIYEDVRTYLAELNNKGYAGLNNWRLPTLEEAMSLVEPKMMDRNLHIDSKFDRIQRYIWTSDKEKKYFNPWMVSFTSGSCRDLSSFDGRSYVRAVRSAQSSQ